MGSQLFAAGGAWASSVPTSAAGAPPRGPTISILSTTDLHGHIESLPRIGGLAANVRRARRADGGGVLLVDAGDAFQGELASNLNEGARVVDAMNAIGYSAAAIGNHEFDFGPVGPVSIPRPGDDPRGALKARAAQAKYPVLAANLIELGTGQPSHARNIQPSAIVEVAGVRVGLIGLLTLETTQSVLASVFAGLGLTPLEDAIAREARLLRARGATVVVVVAHAGGGCTRFDNPDDLSSCRQDDEIFKVVRSLPPNTVDAVVAGHAHDRIAHRVAGVPVIEAGKSGETLGRVDLYVDPVSHRVVGSKVFPLETRTTLTYEGAPVVDDPEASRIAAQAIATAAKLRQRPLGVTLNGPIVRGRGTESALGNLVADLMRKARPQADVALTHAGGLRADLPAGPLVYGALYEVYPRDSNFALATLTAGQLESALAENVAGPSGLLISLSGIRARAECREGALSVRLYRQDGRPFAATDSLVVATNTLLAGGARGPLAGARWAVEDGPPVRDELARVLEGAGGVIDASAQTLVDPRRPRFEIPGPAPVSCKPAAHAAAP